MDQAPGLGRVAERLSLDDSAILAPLEAQFGQVRSRARVRDLAEVFTHRREVDAVLNLMPLAFERLDAKFLEPSCGSGNFLTEILRRKLNLASKPRFSSQQRFEFRLLRAVASVYGVDVSHQNVTEARGRLAQVLLEHYGSHTNVDLATIGFRRTAALMLNSNIVAADSCNALHTVELCDWRVRPRGRFQRVWSFALIPPNERHPSWTEYMQDHAPLHFSVLAAAPNTSEVQR